ncbi:squalene synthase 1-like [Punica granatum]|uniref:Squalene synthase 1-like n=1 Tax=Punica granatum TaxID=22663 RepID=A0A218X697_PUNGR|nr:squalene synthase 1-like [Punica granatum]OWM80308.1 hypothetical protein CDL15_Pgr019588 [Punica granatum]
MGGLWEILKRERERVAAMGGFWECGEIAEMIGGLWETLMHPDEIYLLIKLGLRICTSENRTPPESQLAFCYKVIPKITLAYRLVPSLEQVDPKMVNAVAIFYFVLRALDTVEDDMSLSSEVKKQILENFHNHLYDHDWHFSCGSSKYHRALMDQFHLIRQAFLELDNSYQEVIKDVTKTMGAGMATFIDKEIVTIKDWNEYGHYVAGIVAVALLKMYFQPSRIEDLDSEYNLMAYSCAIFVMKVDMIQDYLQDINEIPSPRMFWPREIWSKYVYKLEDLKYEENSVKAVQCLNDMVTSSLVHAEDCLKFLSASVDPSVFQVGAFILVQQFGTLALCYNNINVFRSKVGPRLGLNAKIIERTRTMSDVYGAFFEFCNLMKSKVDKHDPNATETVSRLEAIQKICMDSGMLNYRKFYIIRSQKGYNSILIVGLSVLILSIVAYLSARRLVI